MTDEERREAERLAIEFEGHKHSEALSETIKFNFIAGFAAACEAKRAQYIRGKPALWEDLQAERARSAKLIESLQDIGSGAYEAYVKIAWSAIAEYEASRD